MASNIKYEIKTGVDTLDLIVSKDHIEKLKKIKGVDVTKSIPLKCNKWKIVIKPSIDGLKTCNSEEVVRFVESIRRQIEEEGEVDRLDIANDFINLSLELDYKLLRLFLECFRISRKLKTPVFSTITGVNKKGNIKIKSDSMQLTIYDCTDKLRASNLRLEYRNTKIKEASTRKAIDKCKKKFKANLKNIKAVLPIVEAYYTRELIAIYDKEIFMGKIVNFKDFIIRYSDELLTKNIFNKIYEHGGLCGNSGKWLENYRKSRELNFISAKELDKMVKGLRDGIKQL